MKPTLYIHIGRPKTGSSALQTFLYQNRTTLADRGICYPEVGRYQRASHKLSLLYLPRLPDSTVVKGITAESMYAELAREILDSGAASAVISSEHFWLINPKQLPALLQEQFDVRIVAYLRRQDDVLISSFIQEVKSGSLSIDVDLDAYTQDSRRLNLLDYEQVLQRWAAAFSQDNIIVRLYEDLAEEHGIECDFLSIIGQAEETGFKFSDVRRNVSPPLEVLRLVDELEGLDLDKISKRRLIALFSKASHVLDSREGTSASALLSTAQRRQILLKFEPSNVQLGQAFLSQPGSPFPGLVEVDEVQAANSKVGTLDVEQRSRLLTATVAEQQRQLGIIKNRLARAEEALGVDGGSRRREQQTHLSNSWLARLKRLLGIGPN